MSADLSVVICSLNGAAGVDRCLRALAGPHARLRDDQWTAIRALVSQVRDPEEASSFPAPASVRHKAASTPSASCRTVPHQTANRSDARPRPVSYQVCFAARPQGHPDPG